MPTNHPRYEMLAFADLDCEQQVDAEWHDSYVLARRAADQAFVNGAVEFVCVRDHSRAGFFPYRASR